MNPLPPGVTLGTFGELLTQLRLLEYRVQAAPPVKDSGNDLIAVRDQTFKAIQVKSCSGPRLRLPVASALPDHYHILALAHFPTSDPPFRLDEVIIYLLSRAEVEEEGRASRGTERFRLSEERISVLFG